MGKATAQAPIEWAREYRFVLMWGLIALAVTSIPYVMGAALATDELVFGGFVYAVEDCYSYLAKMRQGAEGAWLFHLPYTPEPHPSALIYPFYLLLGKITPLLPGGDLTTRMVWVYHAARCVFGLGLLVTVYRFLAALDGRVSVRRLAWLMVTFGGGLGWLLIALGRSDWLGSVPLDFILPEGFTFLVLYAFPHIALGRTLLLWGLLFLLRAWQVDGETHAGQRAFSVGWAALAGLVWLLMGLIVPFYVAVAWAVAGAGWIVLAVREALGGGDPRPSRFPRESLTGAGFRRPTQESGVDEESGNRDPRPLGFPAKPLTGAGAGRPTEERAEHQESDDRDPRPSGSPTKPLTGTGAGKSTEESAEQQESGDRDPRPLGFPTKHLTSTGSRKPTEKSAERGASQSPKGLSVAGRLRVSARGLPWDKAGLAGIAVVISAPVVLYSAWRFTSHPVYAAWASQNRVLSPHPLHYLAAYCVPLALAAFAVGDTWQSRRPAWLALAWVGVVPLLIYLPFNLQRRLVEGVQVPLSLLAAMGLTRITSPKAQSQKPKAGIPRSESKSPKPKAEIPRAEGSNCARSGSADPDEQRGFGNPLGARGDLGACRGRESARKAQSPKPKAETPEPNGSNCARRGSADPAQERGSDNRLGAPGDLGASGGRGSGDSPGASRDLGASGEGGSDDPLGAGVGRGFGNPLGADVGQGRGNPSGAVQKRGSGRPPGARPRRCSLRSRLAVSIVVLALVPSNVMLIAGNTMVVRGRPSPIFRDGAEVGALDWLSRQVEPDDVVLASYETGNYLPARVGARAFVGHGPESVDAAEKKAVVARYFDEATEEPWREDLLSQYSVDFVFWGPAERDLGTFDPESADYLRRVYEAEGYALFAVGG